jgi:hypothetical protein
VGCGAQQGTSGSFTAADSGTHAADDAGTPPPGDSGSSVYDAAPSGSGDYPVTIGPIPVGGGVETTQCIVRPMGNTEPIVIEGFDSTLAVGSHHLIVYLTNAAVQANPVPCSPFTNVVAGSDSPLAIIDRRQITFAMPQGIGLDIPANANVRVEAHYINATSSMLQGQGLVTFHAVPKATAPPYQPASFLFYGTTNINIPPGATVSTNPIFQRGPAGTQYFLAMTHQHRLGTGVALWGSAHAGDMSNQLLDDKDWSNPSWQLLSPMMAFDGTSGLTFECSWVNSTSKAVSFGESALQEMCFVGGYYYPAKGFEFCLDGLCAFR